MHVEGLVVACEAVDAADDNLPELLPAAATSLELLFLMTATTPLCCCLPNLLLPVSSLSPSITSFKIPFLFTMFNECVSGANHE
jgi:hypothetical protein